MGCSVMAIGEVGEVGYLKIDSEADRATVETILFNNGYTVSRVRQKSGKSFQYLIKYEIRPKDIELTEEA